MTVATQRVVHSSDPPNAEPVPGVLGASFITPTEHFYTRCHLTVPDVDAASYKVTVEGKGLQSRTFTLDDLRALEKRTVTASLQCAGNRRLEMTRIHAIKGDPWNIGAIGTANFAGARLLDVLHLAGLNDPSSAGITHMQFEGLDVDDSGRYGASIPAKLALRPDADVLLAYEMNGRPLTKEHGFPLRIVAPGIVGARCVKWVSRIVASDEENDSQWQKRDYKVFSPDVRDYEDVEWASMPAIMELNVHSAICRPADGTAVDRSSDEVAVSGYAYSGGGRAVCRVDVSGDGGKSWRRAQLLPKEAEQQSRDWSWTFWRADLPIPRGAESMQLCCKATDEAHNTQPADVDQIWNIRGVMNNAYHRVSVKVL